MNGVNYYQLFAVSPSATTDELRAQYRKLSLTHHPDRGGTTQQMAELNEAYRVLSNPLLRREYDAKRTMLAVSSDDYHYHPAPPRSPSYAPAAVVEQPSRYFWRWFTVFTLLGLALVIYDVMMTWVMPRYVIESSAHASSEQFTPSGDLTDEAASALSEFQPAPAPTPRTQP